MEKPPELNPILFIDTDVIASSLVPSGYPGAATEKYFVEGYPELVVRLNPGESPDDVFDSIAAEQNLAAYGFNVLPWHPIEHQGEVYIVTLKVHGRPLLEALADTPELVAHADQTWADLAHYIADTYDKGLPVASDIEVPGQYMYGHTAVDTEDKLTLVDHSVTSGTIPTDRSYCKALVDLSGAIVQLEAASGQSFDLARFKLSGAMAALPEGFDLTEPAKRLIHKIFEEKLTFVDLEEFIEEET